MLPIRRVEGRAIPLPQADIDTDQIIPARHLKRIERTGYGAFAFEAWRQDPGFVLNDPRYHRAPILLAGPNFGCGSSREHAPWAIHDLGIVVILAPSFADIFRSNCAKVGILCVALPSATWQAFVDRAVQAPDETFCVDLERQTASAAGGHLETSFEVDPFVKHCLLHGLDAIGLTLEHEAAISAYERSHRVLAPSIPSDLGHRP